MFAFKATVLWVDDDDHATAYGTLQPDDRHVQQTYDGHVWRVDAAPERGADAKRPPADTEPGAGSSEGVAVFEQNCRMDLEDPHDQGDLQEPPYHGTVWFSPELITPGDPTALVGIEATGQPSIHCIPSLYLFQNGATSGFEMYFAVGS